MTTACLFQSNTNETKTSMDPASSFSRDLQATATTGRTILTILYLFILSCCFVVPLFYYLRMNCEERRRARERQRDAADGEDDEGNDQSREGRRTRRKLYKEFKRAQILQLFAPVRVKLTKEDFPHLKDASSDESKPEVRDDLELGLQRNRPGADTVDLTSTDNQSLRRTSSRKEQALDISSPSDGETDFEDVYFDETTFVEIPTQGLHLLESETKTENRLVPNLCAICISHYEIGDEIVWSSNAACEHAFHEECIEQWLMKQKGYPLCPCCRRDFVVDPYDGTEGSLVLSPDVDGGDDGDVLLAPSSATSRTQDSSAVEREA